MNINGIAFGPPQMAHASPAIQQGAPGPVATPAVQASTRVELTLLGSGQTGSGELSPVGFAKTGVAAYSSIAA